MSKNMPGFAAALIEDAVTIAGSVAVVAQF
jgi:hypothetical protein